MADQNKKAQEKPPGSSRQSYDENQPSVASSTSAPTQPSSSSTPIAAFPTLDSTNPVGTTGTNNARPHQNIQSSSNDTVGSSGERPRFRSASIAYVAKSTEKSAVTHKSSEGTQIHSVNSFENESPSRLVVTSQAPPVKRTFSGRNRHRQSGLFSEDDMSIDISATASLHLIRPVAATEGRKQSGLGGRLSSAVPVLVTTDVPPPKHHATSIAGSSIGSASLGSSSEIIAFDESAEHHRRKHRYRPFRRKWRRFQRKYKGCIFALLSSLCSSLSSYFVHMLTTNSRGKGKQVYDATYCLLWRYFGVLFPGIFIVMYYWWCHKEHVFDTVWPLNKKETLKRFGLSVLRSVVDVVAVLLNYYAFRTLLQSETSTILNSKPIVVQLLAHFTLGEPWGVVPILMSLFAAIGVLVISKPPFLEGKPMEGAFEQRLEGVFLSTASMLLASVVYVILRYLKDVHYSVFSLFIGTVGIILGLGLTLGTNKFVAPHVEDLAFFISMASLVCCSSISIVIALQNEEAFVVSLVRSCDVIFSFIWEISLKGKYPDWFSGGGACIVMFCVVVIFFRKYLTHQDENSKIYKRFHFLTK